MKDPRRKATKEEDDGLVLFFEVINPNEILSPSSISDSIVIGFWVGLAVFVIFMFFVLTLLTKTGAPHQE